MIWLRSRSRIQAPARGRAGPNIPFADECVRRLPNQYLPAYVGKHHLM